MSFDVCEKKSWECKVLEKTPMMLEWCWSCGEWQVVIKLIRENTHNVDSNNRTLNHIYKTFFSLKAKRFFLPRIGVFFFLLFYSLSRKSKKWKCCVCISWMPSAFNEFDSRQRLNWLPRANESKRLAIIIKAKQCRLNDEIRMMFEVREKWYKRKTSICQYVCTRNINEGHKNDW